MSWEAANWASQQRGGLPAAEKFLLLQMANWSAPEGNDHIVWNTKSTQAGLATATNQSVSTVGRQLKDLEQRGLISREHRLNSPDTIVLHGDVILVDEDPGSVNMTGTGSVKMTTTALSPVTTTARSTVTEPKSKNLKQEPTTTTRDSVAAPSLQLLAVEAPTSTVPNRFEEFWDLYPRKTSRKDAQDEWDKAVRKVPDPSVIIDALRAQRPTLLASEVKFRPEARRWLHAERWNDEVARPKRASSDGYWG